MDDNKAINKLGEAIDLIRMIEDLTGPSTMDRLSPGTMAGIRITLKNVREAIQGSHAMLLKAPAAAVRGSEERANSLQEVATAANSAAATPTTIIEQEKTESPSLTDPNYRSLSFHDAQKSVLIRRDLRSSLEKLVDR